MKPDEVIVKKILKATIKNFNGVTIQGAKGEKGDVGAPGPQGAKGKDGKNGKDGLNGRDGIDGVNGIDGMNGADGKDGSPDTPEQISDKLNTLEGKVDKKVIKGLSELENKLETLANRPQFISGGGVAGVSKIVAGAGVSITPVDGRGDVTINASATGGINEDSFGIVVDGAGTVLTTGSKGVRYIPWDCTITGWDIRSDVSGSCVFNVKRASVSLAGTEKPTLSASSSNADLTLSTWTTSLLAGDVVEFEIESASTITRATLTILVTKV